jgi:uncharacterized protein YecE (DUF72 family)
MSSESGILIGTSGFSFPDWHGTVYPPDLRKRKIHELEFLSEFINFCEINNTFYRPLNPETAKKWCQFVAQHKDFQFSCKLTEVFTHSPGRGKKESSSAETIMYTQKDVEDAKRGFEPLMNEGRLAALLLQFPISFRYSEGNWDHLIDVLHLFRGYPLSVEVRHKSWMDPLILKALEEERVCFCNIDVTRLGEMLEGTEYVTAPFAYLRLHGRSKEWFTAENRDQRYDYLYSLPSLEKVKTKVERLTSKTEKMLVAFNNHYKGQAAANAIELRSMLQGKKVRAPESLVKTYPELQELALSESIREPLREHF